MSSPDFVRFLSTTLGAAASVSREGAVHFVCIDWQHIAELMAAAEPVYGEAIDVAVWVKSKAGQGSRLSQPARVHQRISRRKHAAYQHRRAAIGVRARTSGTTPR